jgi:replication factor C subunit 2/4
MDIIGTVYRVTKNYNSEAMPEYVKLEMIREIGGGLYKLNSVYR